MAFTTEQFLSPDIFHAHSKKKKKKIKCEIVTYFKTTCYFVNKTYQDFDVDFSNPT